MFVVGKSVLGYVLLRSVELRWLNTYNTNSCRRSMSILGIGRDSVCGIFVLFLLVTHNFR